MKKMAVLLSTVLVLALAACGGPKHDTPMDTAKSFMEAMIAGDSEAIDELNHSSPLSFPTQHLISVANKRDIVGMDIGDFKFEESEDDDKTVVVSWEDEDGNKKDWDLMFVEEEDGYYFTKLR